MAVLNKAIIISIDILITILETIKTTINQIT